LLICTGLVLALLGGGVWYLAPAEARKDDDVAGHLTEALSACPVWRWNLARGHVHWSGAMYRLLGRLPVNETMAFRTIAQSLHPETLCPPPSIATCAAERRISIKASACATRMVIG
jgi:two-component system cell cycle sensor histidine kinase PleC